VIAKGPCGGEGYLTSSSVRARRFIAWCKQEQASIQQQLELMETGVLTGENRGSGWVDTTAESIERARARFTELESLLTETGSATNLPVAKRVRTRLLGLALIAAAASVAAASAAAASAPAGRAAIAVVRSCTG
jgi:hypothetical protein